MGGQIWSSGSSLEMMSIDVKNVSKIFRIIENKNEEKIFGRFWGRKYIEKRAVNNVNFQVGEGEIVGYLGLNGAGKSTTIKMLTGIITPTTGEILINGKTQGKDRKSINKEISVVLGQKSQLWWDLPVVDSLKIAKSMYGLDEYNYKENYDVLNSMLDIESIINVPVRQLSLGQRMKADLCFALIHNPKIIFLDEPTIGLDIITKEQVHNCIKYLNKQYNTTVFLTTHDVNDIDELCKRTIIIDKGNIVYDNSLDSLKTDFSEENDERVELRDVLRKIYKSFGD